MPIPTSLPTTNEERESREKRMADKERGPISNGAGFCDLPEGCIAAIVSLTTPIDACRLAEVSKVFRSAADSDVVWQRFLPADCDLEVARSDQGQALLDEIRSRKQLYMRLGCRPLLVDGATKSFWLEKSTGKKCWMIGARSLNIAWSDTPTYWKWTSVSNSRFPEVAELITVCWFEIRGMIKTTMLSPGTLYAAYLVYNVEEDKAYGLNALSEATVATVGGKAMTKQVLLTYEVTPYLRLVRPRGFVGRLPSFGQLRFKEPRTEDKYPIPRADGWQELKIGEFYTRSDEEDEVELSVLEVKAGNWKGGLVVEGIEVRPVVAKQVAEEAK